MATTIAVDIVGITKLQKLWKYELKKLIDPIVDEMSAYYMARVQERFKKMENPDGSPWKPSLNALIRAAGGKTRASNGKMMGGGQTLFVSGILSRTLSKKKIGPGVATVRFLSKVAPYLEGFDGRTMLGLSNQDEWMMTNIANSRLRDVIKGM